MACCPLQIEQQKVSSKAESNLGSVKQKRDDHSTEQLVLISILSSIAPSPPQPTEELVSHPHRGVTHLHCSQFAGADAFCIRCTLKPYNLVFRSQISPKGGRIKVLVPPQNNRLFEGFCDGDDRAIMSDYGLTGH